MRSSPKPFAPKPFAPKPFAPKPFAPKSSAPKPSAPLSISNDFGALPAIHAGASNLFVFLGRLSGRDFTMICYRDR
jgi:hypothetical protein